MENLNNTYQSFFAPANYFFSGYFSFSASYYRNFRTYYRFYWYC
ncbi:PheST operon leader peptide PheM [Chryseobacterium sp. IT-36CA2]